MKQTQELWNVLKSSQIVTGDMPKDIEISQPWYIRLVQGFAGWFAAILMLLFFGFALGNLFVIPSSLVLFVIGVINSFISYQIFKSKNTDFMQQFALALSLAGQVMVGIAIVMYFDKRSSFGFFVYGFYQMFLVWLLPHYMHRLLSTFFACTTFMTALFILGVDAIGLSIIALSCSWLWLKEKWWAQKSQLFEPMAFGSSLSLIANGSTFYTGGLFFQSTIKHTSWFANHSDYISSIFITLVFLYVVISIADEYHIKKSLKNKLIFIIIAALLVLINFYIFGISIGLLITFLGLISHRKSLLSIGIIAVIGFFSWYYYNLDISLMNKSIILMVFGLVLIIIYVVLNKYHNMNFDKSEKVNSGSPNKLIFLTTILLLLVSVNFNIYQKQQIIKNGERILLKLAPVDPRSLIQGDYMRLGFDISTQISNQIRQQGNENSNGNSQGQVLVEKDSHDVVAFIELYQGQEIKTKQLLISYKIRRNRVLISTDAYYFQEGKADHFSHAKFGEFKRAQNGEMLLINMLDENMQLL